MLHVERVGTVQLLHLGALLHVIYERGSLRIGANGSAGSTADSGGSCHLSPEKGMKAWTLFLAGNWIFPWLLHEK